MNVVSGLVIDNVLPDEKLAYLKHYISNEQFTPVDIGGAEMYVMALPEEIKHWLVGFIEGTVDKELVDVATFIRYNSAEHDTSFRVHSDGLIQGLQPTIASVLYLTTGHTGTALYEHPVHGSEGLGKIFMVDDGQWGIVDFCEEIENTMFIYNANSFHSRLPHKAKGERVVVVSFLKEK